MSDHTHALIIELGTQAGMIMEDAVLPALTLGSLSGDELGTALDQLAVQAEQITRLIEAARALQSCRSQEQA